MLAVVAVVVAVWVLIGFCVDGGGIVVGVDVITAVVVGCWLL